MTVMFALLLGNYYLFYQSLNNKQSDPDMSVTYSKANTCVSVTLTVFINAVLMYSVNKIRNIIKSKEFIDPNEKFILIHLINFFIASIFQVI